MHVFVSNAHLLLYLYQIMWIKHEARGTLIWKRRGFLSTRLGMWFYLQFSVSIRMFKTESQCFYPLRYRLGLYEKNYLHKTNEPLSFCVEGSIWFPRLQHNDNIYISSLVVCFSTVSFAAKESLSHTTIGLLKRFNSNFAFIWESLSPALTPG